MKTDNLRSQAYIFTRYLIKQRPSMASVKLYEQAVRSLETPSLSDQKLLIFIEQHPLSVSLVDAGLPFYRPYSELRRRLYIMLAILEASPDYYNDFLPKERGPIYPLFVIYVGVRAAFKTLTGSLLIRIIS